MNNLNVLLRFFTALCRNVLCITNSMNYFSRRAMRMCIQPNFIVWCAVILVIRIFKCGIRVRVMRVWLRYFLGRSFLNCPSYIWVNVRCFVFSKEVMRTSRTFIVANHFVKLWLSKRRFSTALNSWNTIVTSFLLNAYTDSFIKGVIKQWWLIQWSLILISDKLTLLRNLIFFNCNFHFFRRRHICTLIVKLSDKVV